MWTPTARIPIACRLEPANVSGRIAGARLLGGLSPLFSAHQDRNRRCRAREQEAGTATDARQRLETANCKRKQRAFKVAGPTWFVERTFAWLSRNRRFNKDYEYGVQTSETMIDIAAIRLMLNRIVPT